MDKKTYEALNRYLENTRDIRFAYFEAVDDRNQLLKWIDEVAKEYAEGGEQDENPNIPSERNTI